MEKIDFQKIINSKVGSENKLLDQKRFWVFSTLNYDLVSNDEPSLK